MKMNTIDEMFKMSKGTEEILGFNNSRKNIKRRMKPYEIILLRDVKAGDRICFNYSLPYSSHSSSPSPSSSHPHPIYPLSNKVPLYNIISVEKQETNFSFRARISFLNISIKVEGPPTTYKGQLEDKETLLPIKVARYLTIPSIFTEL